VIVGMAGLATFGGGFAVARLLDNPKVPSQRQATLPTPDHPRVAGLGTVAPLPGLKRPPVAPVTPTSEAAPPPEIDSGSPAPSEGDLGGGADSGERTPTPTPEPEPTPKEPTRTTTQ